jgi:hypothetical protein
VPQPVVEFRWLVAAAQRSQLLSDVLFGHPSFVNQPGIVQRLDVRQVQTAQVVHQPHVHEQQLARVVAGVGAKRQSRTVAVRDPVTDARLDQQIDRATHFRRARIRVEAAVAHGMPHGSGHEAEQPLEAGERRPPGVLGEIVLIGRSDGAVDGRHLHRGTRLAVRQYRLGQSADHEVLAKPPTKSTVCSIGQWRVQLQVGGRPGGRGVDGSQELAKRQRSQMQVLNAPYRHGESVLAEGELE